MNPRIFKKLTKAAANELDRLGVKYIGERFESSGCGDDCPEVKWGFNWERKSLERCCGKLTEYPMLLGGTVGYGAVSGYYEPEWDDSDALSCLFWHVTELFTEWSQSGAGVYPEDKCPKILKKSARHLIAYVKTLNPEGG